MRAFTHKVVKTLEKIAEMEEVGIKTASDKGSMEAQDYCAASAWQLYDVMEKKAGAKPSKWEGMCELVQKMASYTPHRAVLPEVLAKVAAAVVIDNTLRSQLGDDLEKNAEILETIAYGREYIADVLRGALV